MDASKMILRILLGITATFSLLTTSASAQTEKNLLNSRGLPENLLLTNESLFTISLATETHHNINEHSDTGTLEHFATQTTATNSPSSLDSVVEQKLNTFTSSVTGRVRRTTLPVAGNKSSTAVHSDDPSTHSAVIRDITPSEVSHHLPVTRPGNSEAVSSLMSSTMSTEQTRVDEGPTDGRSLVSSVSSASSEPSSGGDGVMEDPITSSITLASTEKPSGEESPTMDPSSMSTSTSASTELSGMAQDNLSDLSSRSTNTLTSVELTSGRETRMDQVSTSSNSSTPTELSRTQNIIDLSSMSSSSSSSISITGVEVSIIDQASTSLNSSTSTELSSSTQDTIPDLPSTSSSASSSIGITGGEVSITDQSSMSLSSSTAPNKLPSEGVSRTDPTSAGSSSSPGKATELSTASETSSDDSTSNSPATAELTRNYTTTTRSSTASNNSEESSTRLSFIGSATTQGSTDAETTTSNAFHPSPTTTHASSGTPETTRLTTLSFQRTNTFGTSRFSTPSSERNEKTETTDMFQTSGVSTPSSLRTDLFETSIVTTPSSERTGKSETSGLTTPSSERTDMSETSGLTIPSSERTDMSETSGFTTPSSETSELTTPSSEGTDMSETSGLTTPSSERTDKSETSGLTTPSSETSGLTTPSSETSELTTPSSERTDMSETSGLTTPSSERTDKSETSGLTTHYFEGTISHTGSSLTSESASTEHTTTTIDVTMKKDTEPPASSSTYNGTTESYTKRPKETNGVCKTNKENMTEEEEGGVVTTVFTAPEEQGRQWIKDDDTHFREIISFHLEKYVNEREAIDKERSSYDRHLEKRSVQLESASLKTPKTKRHGKLEKIAVDDVIFVDPTPICQFSKIYVTFFVRVTGARNYSVVPSEIVIDMLSSKRKEVEDEMDLTLLGARPGFYKDPLDTITSESTLDKYSSLILATSISVGACTIVLMIAIGIVRCRTSSGRSEYLTNDVTKLRKDPTHHCTVEIGNLNADKDILKDEVDSCNGNSGRPYPVHLDEGEGWIVPLKDVPLEEKSPLETQDTKL